MSTPDLLKLRIGVSACLLGQEVRYNGGHKRDAFLTDTFGRYVEWVAVCPEVEVGMGTPRPPIRLERRGEEVRLVTPSTGEDSTEARACLVRAAGRRAGGDGPRRLRAQGGLAELRRGAGQGLCRRGRSRGGWPGSLRRGADGAPAGPPAPGRSSASPP